MNSVTTGTNTNSHTIGTYDIGSNDGYKIIIVMETFHKSQYTTEHSPHTEIQQNYNALKARYGLQ